MYWALCILLAGSSALGTVHTVGRQQCTGHCAYCRQAALHSSVSMEKRMGLISLTATTVHKGQNVAFTWQQTLRNEPHCAAPLLLLSSCREYVKYTDNCSY